MTHWDVYWFTRLDSLVTVFQVLLITGIVGLVPFIICLITEYGDYGDDKQKKIINWLKVLLSGLVFSMLCLMFIPTTKEAAAIYLLPKIANSEFAKEAEKIPEGAAKLMNLKLQEWIDEVSKTKKEK